MTKTWLNLSIAVGLVFLLAVSGCADFQAEPDALQRGDSDTALKELQSLADQGDAMAQNNLGLMYIKGQGVPQEYTEAVKWYRLAVEQGDAVAQANLGLMYAKGQGVAQNYIQAYMWETLAAAQGNENASKGLEILEKGMTPDLIAAAQRLAREWTPKGK